MCIVVSAVSNEFGERVPELRGELWRRRCHPMSGVWAYVGWMGGWHQRAEPTEWSVVVVEQVGEGGGGLIMEGSVSEEKDFVLDPLWDGEPVKVLEKRGDVSSRVLDELRVI